MTMLYRYLIVLLLADSAVHSTAEEANDPDGNTGAESPSSGWGTCAFPAAADSYGQ